MHLLKDMKMLFQQS